MRPVCFLNYIIILLHIIMIQTWYLFRNIPTTPTTITKSYKLPRIRQIKNKTMEKTFAIDIDIDTIVVIILYADKLLYWWPVKRTYDKNYWYYFCTVTVIGFICIVVQVFCWIISIYNSKLWFFRCQLLSNPIDSVNKHWKSG